MVYVTSHHLKTELSNKIPAGDFSTRSLAAEDHQLNGKERVPQSVQPIVEWKEEGWKEKKLLEVFSQIIG